MRTVSEIIALAVEDNVGTHIRFYKDMAAMANYWYRTDDYFDTNMGMPDSISFTIRYTDSTFELFTVNRNDSRLSDDYGTYGPGALIEFFRKDIYGTAGDEKDKGLYNLSDTDKNNLFLAVSAYYIAIIKEEAKSTISKLVKDLEYYYIAKSVLPPKYKHQFHCFRRAMNETTESIVEKMQEDIKYAIDHKDDETT